MKNLIILIFLTVFITACHRDDTQNLNLEESNAVKIVKRENLSSTKNYKNFLDALNADVLSYFDTDVYADRKSSQQVIYSNLPSINLKYDNQEIVKDEDGKVNSEYLHQILGKQTVVSVSNDSDLLLEKEVYLPKILEIYNVPGILDTSFISEVYRIDRKDLILQTNEDPLNKNGILIFAVWDGMTGNPTFDNIENKERTGKELLLHTNQDNGQIIIPENVLQEFPRGAHVGFLINRGNFEKFSSKGHNLVIGSRTENLVQTILE